MRTTTRLWAVLAGAVAPAVVALVFGVTPVAAQGSPAAPHARDVCATAAPGHARCFARVRTDVSGGRGVRGAAAHAAAPAGLGPADLRSAYGLPATGGANQTVGIVDAGDDPNAEADLAVYRSTYGLPACTTANGCFRKVNQRGATSPLPPNQGWSIEIALDLDMVSAACPQCHIVLVEGDDASFAALAASVDQAVTLGATEVSNSYGGTEANGLDQWAKDYSHPGVAILASSGDSGYGTPNTPAVYPSVIAVGGTSLTRDSSARGWTESAWSGASSGCSAWVAKPSWQSDPNCPGRMVADVSADADPATGPAVYETVDAPGWIVVGGTSAASPYVAGVIALAGNPQRYPDASYFYTHASDLYDITTGGNGVHQDCGGDYQCTAGPGYDGPTGNGSPHGLAAF